MEHRISLDEMDERAPTFEDFRTARPEWADEIPDPTTLEASIAVLRDLAARYAAARPEPIEPRTAAARADWLLKNKLRDQIEMVAAEMRGLAAMEEADLRARLRDYPDLIDHYLIRPYIANGGMAWKPEGIGALLRDRYGARVDSSRGHVECTIDSSGVRVRIDQTMAFKPVTSGQRIRVEWGYSGRPLTVNYHYEVTQLRDEQWHIVAEWSDVHGKITDGGRLERELMALGLGGVYYWGPQDDESDS